MNKKKIIIYSILIFLLCFLTHFIYDWIPIGFFAIFFPVNESTWEHMKMLYTTILLFGFIRSMIRIYEHQEIHLFSIWVSAVCSIPIYLILYLPIYYMVGYHMWIALTILMITIILSQMIEQKLTRKENKMTFFITIIGIILSYVGFGYLTYHPILTDLFYDHQSELYGINYHSIE